MSILALDAGTTGVTALVVDTDGRVSSRGYATFPQHFPAPGLVEHDPEEIWAATLAAVSMARVGGGPIDAVGVTNQRETLVVWDRQTLAAPRPAIVWQDRRTAELCQKLREQGLETTVIERTGLRLDPYFTATRLLWLALHEPDVHAGLTSGRYVAGTVDAYLIARMTGGRTWATDASNASRTLLASLGGGYDAQLLDMFDVPVGALAPIVDSSGIIATVDPQCLPGIDAPIAGVAGDQQAALFGQGCLGPGETKCTYGTGAFVLMQAGATPPAARDGLLTTVAWQIGGQRSYAVEGSLFTAGALIDWLRDSLGLVAASPEIEQLARRVPTSAGVSLVPALAGLGAPHWDPQARGALLGLSRATTQEHIARAAIEAIVFGVADVMAALADVAETAPVRLAVDGGAAANDLLCQWQADLTGVPVVRPALLETTAFGAALLAGLALGIWQPDALPRPGGSTTTFEPQENQPLSEAYARYPRAVAAARSFGS